MYLYCFISTDDRDAFVDVLKSIDPKRLESLRLDILKRLSCSHAMNCATALLEGEAGLPAPVDLNVVLPETGTYPLHEAASQLNFELVDLFLRHGARTDVRSVESDLLPCCP